MHHIFLSLIILSLLFIPLARFYSADRAHTLLCWIPIVLAASAWSYEEFIGFGMIPHVVWHLSFDMSYILAMAGIVIILRAFVLKRRIVILILGTCLASLPIIAMMWFHW
jgi:hypothetical protein